MEDGGESLQSFGEAFGAAAGAADVRGSAATGAADAAAAPLRSSAVKTRPTLAITPRRVADDKRRAGSAAPLCAGRAGDRSRALFTAAAADRARRADAAPVHSWPAGRVVIYRATSSLHPEPGRPLIFQTLAIARPAMDTPTGEPNKAAVTTQKRRAGLNRAGGGVAWPGSVLRCIGLHGLTRPSVIVRHSSRLQNGWPVRRPVRHTHTRAQYSGQKPPRAARYTCAGWCHTCALLRRLHGSSYIGRGPPASFQYLPALVFA